MKRTPVYILIVLILVAGSFLASTHVAEAAKAATTGAGFLTKLFDFDFWGFVSNTVNAVMFIFLAIASWFVALTGSLLNVSINLTLNIKAFVESTTAIYDIWKVIRDLSGMFIIFFLLYAALQLILGIQKPNFGKLIKDIVIAGILINFSFFITGFLIDMSNMTSLVLYRAIVPGQPDVGKMLAGGASSAEATVQAITNKLFDDGGLSAVFMQSLSLQSQFDPNHVKSKPNESTDVSAVFKVILLNWTSILIMVVVGLSFLAASIAFVIRLIILLLLLAFSPIWFAASIVPNLKSYAGKWWGTLVSQLTFMPVYLLLMYAGIYILSKSTIFKIGTSGTMWQGATATGAPTEFIAIAINAVFVIFMLNVPLLAALGMGGSATKFVSKRGWDATTIFKKAGSASWRNTGGRAASALANTNAARDLASRSKVAAYALKNVRGVGADYDKKMEDKIKARTQFAESLGHNEDKMRTAQSVRRSFEQQLASAKARNAPQTLIDHLEQQVRDSKSDITKIENERSTNYSNTVNPPSLLSHVFRADHAASAKIQLPIAEKRLTKQKDDLKETRDDIKQLNKAIKNNAAIPATGTSPAVDAGKPTPAQEAEMTRLLGEESKHITKIGNTEKEIDDLKSLI